MSKYRPNRSQSMQYLFKEIGVDFETNRNIRDFDTTKGIYYSISISEIDLNLLQAANNKCIEILFKASLPQLTPLQRTTLELLKEGKKQSEVAKEINNDIGNSVVQKCLKGNTLYEKGKEPKQQGGINRKIMLICTHSDEYRLSIKELYKLELGGSMLNLTKSWFKTPNEFVFWMEEEIDDRLGLTKTLINQINELIISYWIDINKKPGARLPTLNRLKGISTLLKQREIYKIYLPYIEKRVLKQLKATIQVKFRKDGFTKEELRDLFRLRNQGMTIKDIAKNYKTSQKIIEILLDLDA